ENISSFMSRYVVPNDDVPRTQLRGEKMLDVKFQYLSINCPFDHHRDAYAIKSQCADDRNIAAGFERLNDHSAFSAGRTRVGARHCQMDTEFIQKPQVRRRQSHLFLAERGSLFRVGFARPAGLFLSVKSICCNPRQTVLMLTLTRQRRRSKSRSSSNVASGNS